MSTVEQANDPKPPKGPKSVTIYVNTRPHPYSRERISFEAVVALAYPETPPGVNISYSVLYHRGHGNDEGTLTPGQSVKVKDRMRFDVTATDRS